MKKLGDLFKLKGRFAFKAIFPTEEGKTDLNLLLRLLLNERSIEDSLKLKEELDLKYGEIMGEELKQRSLEVKLISNHLKVNGTDN